MSAAEQQQLAPAEGDGSTGDISTSTSVSTTRSTDDRQQTEEENQSSTSNLPTVGAAATRTSRPLPEARKHTYLPGASHPLYPEEWIGHGSSGGGGTSSPRLSSVPSSHRAQQLNGARSGIPNLALSSKHEECYDLIPPTVPLTRITELPILELDDVILFPGCTVPLRLRHPGWVEYLGARIDEARLGLGNASGTRTGSSEVRIGVLMKMRETRRRNRAWRQRPRPPIQPPATGQGNGAAATTSDAIGAGGGAARGRRGRWRTELLRRGIRRPREPEQDVTARDGDDHAVQDDDQPRQDGGGERDETPRPPLPPLPAVPDSPRDPLVGRVGTMAIITYTHEVAADDGEDNSDDDPPPNVSNRSSRVWQRHSGQLVMTALGTARFRILSRIDSSTWDAENRVHPGLHRGDMADIKLCAVETLIDENFPLPPVSIRRRGTPFCERICRGNDNAADNESRGDTSQYSENFCTDSAQKDLAQCTPLPSYAYKMVWPWRLVQKICNELSEIAAWEGLRSSLPPSSGVVQEDGAVDANNVWFLSSMADPLAFSFWMAANLPLSAYDRLDLLEMDCTVQRLQYILSKVAQQRQLDKPIRCKQCGEPISTISDMFSVGGAEGTTGAYVNEYGIVHQTITVRKCSSTKVFFSGDRETRDSWFPGYTWTIMHCALCYQHLGWKFDLLRQFREPKQQAEDDTDGGSPQQQRQSETLDRPKRFFGLAGGSVTTEESLRPRRVTAEDEARRQLFELMRQAAGQGGDIVVDEDEDDEDNA